MHNLLYSDLLQFVAERRTQDSRDPVAAAIGIQLFEPPLARWNYWCTPTNCVTFATTCGDGVHYGFLLLRGDSNTDSPVVMTYPPGGFGIQNNVVVGANLDDFLCLGMHTGYAELEQLAWRRENFAKRYPAPGEFACWVNPEEIAVLTALARRFALTPWKDLRGRLNSLHREYHGLLRYSEDYYDTIGAAPDA
jgi:hypothetical protein